MYEDTKDVCGVNDVGFEPVGADKTAAFAPTAKGHLSSVLVAPKDVNLADLVKHINECLATPYNERARTLLGRRLQGGGRRLREGHRAVGARAQLTGPRQCVGRSRDGC
ncbi:hypothetical protein ACFV1W_28100 [Kitasatospora sp. NPDC059648]|uniref:hypothetical protein n=1 Tax=Kitasatospora sp. NPDC059648 TaxID=3346894 RepID=UPI0036C6AB29